jgi:hypothetical protein
VVVIGSVLATELDMCVVTWIGDVDVFIVRIRLFAVDRFLTRRAEFLAVVSENWITTLSTMGVCHRRALQQEFAHLLGRRASLILEFLAEFLAFGFLIEVAHTFHNGTGLKTVFGSAEGAQTINRPAG